MKAIEFLENNERKIVKFLQELVSIPSQNGINAEKDIAWVVVKKLKEFGLKPKLVDNKERPSILCVLGKSSGKKLLLNAHLDTVSVGDPKKWKHRPFSGKIMGNKLSGRGSADAKAAVAIFCYLAGALAKTQTRLGGQLILGFDSDEESGNFTGFKHLIKEIGRVDAALIGYPGINEIIIGSRGFLRLEITTFGKAAHTGSQSQKGVNAILKMNRIMTALSNLQLTHKKDHFFRFGPKLTISQISGGWAINIVPDECSINIDIRLVPGQTKEQVIEQIKKTLKFEQDYKIDIFQYQPAFKTDPKERLVKILKRNAEKVLKRKIRLTASGAGGVGNLLGGIRVPTISGFGVEFGNAHGANEWLNIKTILPVAKIYLKTVVEFLATCI